MKNMEPQLSIATALPTAAAAGWGGQLGLGLPGESASMVLLRSKCSSIEVALSSGRNRITEWLRLSGSTVEASGPISQLKQDHPRAQEQDCVQLVLGYLQ